MSSCSTGTCGLSGLGAPQPGDPSNDSVLSATPAFGGIDVAWTYPSSFPYAVAYTKLYRGLTSSFDSAILINEVSGGFYYDKLDNSTRYYYWIRLVSVNGTIGDLIGPASATAKPVISQVIEQLTGLIDSGLLATSLKNEISRIELLSSDLLSEVTAREGGETTLAQAIAQAQQGVAQAHTFIANEVQSRTTQYSALVEQVNGVAATAGNSLAAAMTTLRAEVEDDVSALASQLSGVQATMGNNLATNTTTLRAEIQQGDSALSSRIDQAISELNGSVAAVQQTMTADIDAVAGTVSALWTAQVSVDGLIGGFGLSNNGQTVEAGFDVDRFWIGRTGASRRKPFIVEGDTVYIDQAAINYLTFSKLRDEMGSFIVENGKVKADYLQTQELTVEGISSAVNGGSTEGGRVRITKNLITVFDDNNVARVLIGKLS